MAIQWFPGHMHKARKEIARMLPATDVILEVLDARLPFSSENPMLAEIRTDKPCLKVLTKADLADPECTAEWLQTFTHAIALASNDANSIQHIPTALRQLIPVDRNRIKPCVAMVVGIPNVGKSTLINLLRGKTVAKTGNEPAITKRQQVIELGNGWVLRDTPGVLWPNVDNRASGFRLAATGAIRDTAMDSAEVAVHLLDYLRIHYSEQLRTRYSTDLPLHDSTATLDALGRLRGCLSAGALVDYDRAARVLLTDLRSGQLGRVTLETPSMRVTELAALDLNRTRLAEKRANRRAMRRK